MNYFFDATHTSNKIFFTGEFSLMNAVSFQVLYRTNRLSNRYGQVFGWGLINNL